MRGQVVRHVGGAARARVILLFGLVLGLSGADLSTIGAIAPQLQDSLKINVTQIGLLSSVSLLTGAIATIPVGLFVDRVKRVPLLSASIVARKRLTPRRAAVLASRSIIAVASPWR